MQHVYIVGSKGLPGHYGGFETFVDKLTEYHQHNQNIKYHVACMSKETGDFEYHNAHCFKIKVPSIGVAEAVYHDIAALKWCCKHIEQNNIQNPVVYVLANRIGPVIGRYQKKIHALGGVLYLNPDGHEWKRKKWNVFIRKYWKLSERLMVKHADLLICDSKNIEQYMHETYPQYQLKTTFIPYGSERKLSVLANNDALFQQWLNQHQIESNGYYLIVGRYVPENNYETMIREFMMSDTSKSLVLVSTENKRLHEQLERKLHFKQDSRIKFVGTIYHRELLKKIRENAFAYLHGHEVGGTNPSLLEALGSTKLNLLYDVCFNREVAEDAVLYWTKEKGDLSSLICQAEQISTEEIERYGKAAKKRIENAYSWEHIAEQYEKVMCR